MGLDASSTTAMASSSSRPLSPAQHTLDAERASRELRLARDDLAASVAECDTLRREISDLRDAYSSAVASRESLRRAGAASMGAGASAVAGAGAGSGIVQMPATPSIASTPTTPGNATLVKIARLEEELSRVLDAFDDTRAERDDLRAEADALRDAASRAEGDARALRVYAAAVATAVRHATGDNDVPVSSAEQLHRLTTGESSGARMGLLPPTIDAGSIDTGALRSNAAVASIESSIVTRGGVAESSDSADALFPKVPLLSHVRRLQRSLCAQERRTHRESQRARTLASALRAARRAVGTANLAAFGQQDAVTGTLDPIRDCARGVAAAVDALPREVKAMIGEAGALDALQIGPEQGSRYAN